MTERPKPQCLFPLLDGRRCCECSTCQGFPLEVQRDDAIEALYELRHFARRYLQVDGSYGLWDAIEARKRRNILRKAIGEQVTLTPQEREEAMGDAA